MERLEVVKTGKLWIGGAWPRSESGRTMPIHGADGEVIVRCGDASRKDARDAVEAARKGLPAWRDSTAMLRGQVLYRIAEMLESRAGVCVDALVDQGAKKTSAKREVAASVDRLVCFAGWCDKIDQILGCRNPVAGPYHNFTVPQACGVVAVMAPHEPALLGMVSMVSAAMVMGNSVVAVAPPPAAWTAILLAEAMAVSDVPPGAVNILTGDPTELVAPLGGHREVAVVMAAGLSRSLRQRLRMVAADGLRRVHHLTWSASEWADDAIVATPDVLEHVCEFKTLWHPSAS